jgi:hypothetical protein
MLLSVTCQAQEDSTAAEKPENKILATQRQLRLGVNISTPVINALTSDSLVKRNAYEITLDYAFKNDVYLVLEGGFGGSTINYTDLKYNTNNSYARIGVDKSMLQRLFPNDWDMLFVGVRYGIGLINRSEATFSTNDNFWGTTTGTIPAKNMTAHWAELNAGMRVELLKHLFAGYNIRAKFLANGKAFQELPPAYVAGYGKVEKSTVFDFNFYLCYALRW